ncbi:MAG: carboxypeptidase-like regulatory domain-containing protein [Chlorobi bacterium]|nr:carboxypeptidase-like regulatory domain-containing protein [Chlorobiota bacterium]
MKTFTYSILVAFLTFPVLLFAQDWEIDPMPIRLKAKIISVGDGMPVPYAHIINNRTHGGTTSNAGGFFTLDMLNVDSLVISAMGFTKLSFNVPFNYNPDSILIISLKPLNFAIREVTVEGKKNRVNLDGIPSGKPVDIDPELRGDAFNEKPPVIAALFNPLSYWQYYLSKKERRKRAVREAMAIEKNWEMHSQNYNKKIVMMLTGMNDRQADDFMIWFNALNVLPYTSTEYEVRASIRKYFELYKREGRLKK